MVLWVHLLQLNHNTIVGAWGEVMEVLGTVFITRAHYSGVLRARNPHPVASHTLDEKIPTGRASVVGIKTVLASA